MAIEALFTGFIHLVQVAPGAAGLSLLIGGGTLVGLKSVYFAILTFFVSFGILLAVL